MEINIFTIFIYGYILVASILIYIFNRDRRNNTVFLGKHPKLTLSFISILSIGIVLALYSRFIEPYWLNVTHTTITITPTATGEARLKKPVTLVLISDLHVGDHKKTAWIQKVVNEIKKIEPDLVLLGGDYTVNHGTITDETTYLEPLAELPKLFPTYYVMGNHEYGLYARGFQLNPDKSDFIKKRMADFKITLLLNNFDCPEINQQTMCLFGMDDVYKENFNFSTLTTWNTTTPMILISHNPDGILYWPGNLQKPDLVLAGHTHGGQIYLPFFGPLGRVEVLLGPQYYRGLNYYEKTPVYTTVGLAESGGPIRFWSRPEVSAITLTPQ